MDKIPFKTIGGCCAALTVLIIARCLVSIGRVLYYGGNYWLTVIQADPWLYVSVASAAMSVVCFTMAVIQERQCESSEDEYEEDYEGEEDEE
jgi:hypothetical protein